MTIIDQRILIPTGPEVIWEMVGDISQNPNWQTDCTNISFLTSRRSGQGVRWRYTSSSGHDYVLETTAWYDGLGYEYTYIDGANYRESKGRLRLQEIPEGTIVQWTFSYELPGVISSLRNSMGAKRAIEAVMVESLKNLWRKVNDNRDRAYVHEAKSLIREAIDYEGRQRYRSRHHPSDEGDTQDRHERFKPSAPPPVLREPAEPTRVVIPEPPLAEEDTRPNPAVTAPQVPEPSTTPEPEPDFLANLPPAEEKAAAPVDSTPAPADPPPPRQAEQPPVPAAPLAPEETALTEKLPSTADEPKPTISTPSPAEDDSSRFRPPPVPILDEPAPAEASAQPADVPDKPRETSEHQAVPPVETAEANPETPEEPQRSTRETAKLDTSEMSIWEIFGVPRPSETQEIAAVKIEEALKDAEPPIIVPEAKAEEAEAVPEAVAAPETEVSAVTAASSAPAPAPSPPSVFIVGLRLKHRRKLVRLRRYH